MSVDPSKIARSLTKAQRYHIERGCISGDFSMSTVRALKANGLMYLHIDSPNGRCGFMRMTPLGEAVQSALKAEFQMESP
jgi:hypothetical protein